MQTVYIGDTLVNDIFVGSGRASDVFNISPSIITTSLNFYWDAAYSASAANWRNVLPYGNKTGSLTQTTYTSTSPQSFNLTGSTADIVFGGTVPNALTGSGPYTIQMYVNPVKDTGSMNLFWFGSSGDDLELQVSGSIGSKKYLKIATSSTSSVATNCEVSLNEYHLITLTTDGNNSYSGFNVWVDGNKQAISGSNSFAPIPNLYWVIGANNSQRPLSGSVVSYLVYDRKLSDNEINQNLRYFRARTGYF
jgi:hypothetical protein